MLRGCLIAVAINMLSSTSPALSLQQQSCDEGKDDSVGGGNDIATAGVYAICKTQG